MELKYVMLGLSAAIAVAVYAEQPENVVVADAVEVYSFVDTPDGLVVKAAEKTQYEATRHSEKIYPNVYYDNVIKLDKVSGGKAQYRSINDPAVFHDDSHICYFETFLKEKGAKAKSEFKRTFTDGAYFSKVYLDDNYPVREKLVKIEIPAAYPDIEIVGINLPEDKVIRNDFSNVDGSRTVAFTVSDMPPKVKEKGAPSVMARSPFIIVKGYFKDLDALVRFHSARLDVDTKIPDLEMLLAEITEGASDRDEKISGIYKYVQKKIRYVAFEEGEAGFRPDAPAEVLRKHYGDCKGMAMLLATLLNGAGVEAYVASVGTRDIPFKISEYPSLSATNHMICIVPQPEGNLFLDATNQYIAMHDVPYSIQGKDAIMHKGEDYEMVEVPVRDAGCSSDEAEYDYTVEDGRLSGKVVRRFKGDMLEAFKFSVDGLSTAYKKDVLALTMSPRQKVKVDHESINGRFVEDGLYEVTANFEDENAVTDAGNAVYVDLNTSGDPFVGRIDNAERKYDYELPLRARIVRRSTLNVPDGYSVGELPEGFNGSCSAGEFSCEFVKEGDGKVVMIKTAVINNPLLKLSEIPDWNKTVAAWNEACNHQIELLKN